GDNVEVLFGDVVDPTGTVSQDTTSACGSDSSSSSSSSSCSYLEDHRVCGVDYSVDDVDDTELACICGSGYYEDISSGECVLASSSSSSSECSNCGGERGTCVYDSEYDSDSSDESSPLFCECSDGWYGTDCSSICPVSDDLGLCSGSSRGTCDAPTHTCVCESGYYGSSCNLYCDSLSRCGLHGRCFVDDLSSETLYCKCDAGWYGSTCFTQYPVETVEYVNDDDETNPTIVDYVCGVNYSTDPSSSYSDYGIYSSDTDTYSCDCSSYGLITDASTSTCIDPATHPYYKDIAGNDTACLTCGTSTDSHGTCVLGEGEDSLTVMCQCEYGWGNDVDDSSEPSSSCSVDMCGVSEDTYTESNANICSSHGICYSYSFFDSNISNFQYACECDDGWNGVMCEEEASNVLKIVLLVFIILICVFIIIGIVCFVFWYHLKKNISPENVDIVENQQISKQFDSSEQVLEKQNEQKMDTKREIIQNGDDEHSPTVEHSPSLHLPSECMSSSLSDENVAYDVRPPTVVQIRDDPSLSTLQDASLQVQDHDSSSGCIDPASTVPVMRRVKKSKQQQKGTGEKDGEKKKKRRKKGELKKKHVKGEEGEEKSLQGISELGSSDPMSGSTSESKVKIKKKKKKKVKKKPKPKHILKPIEES
ncbi:hypothetical protein ADUPG1_011985, partial [Aduncisulcus paluster]